MSHQSFSGMLADQFIESFKAALNVLGEAAAKSFYYHIQRKYAMVPADLPRRVRDFDTSLVELFGSGARIIVRTCAEKFGERLGSRIPQDPQSLSDLWLEATQSRIQQARPYPYGSDLGPDRRGNVSSQHSTPS